MSELTPSISVDVDPTNPGQFFACCGLLELADRLWPGSEGWFSGEGLSFHLHCGQNTLDDLVEAIAYAALVHDDPSDPYSSSVSIGEPFRRLTIDWWVHDFLGARDLKVWAGTMESFGIARALQHAMRSPEFKSPNLFNIGLVARNPEDPSKKKEPFYFDARRSTNAHSVDVGFSANDISITSTTHPAVEFLCFIGIQVARPARTDRKRIYDYFLWTVPLTANLILPASTGILRTNDFQRFRYENWFRTGQKKHKAFRPAIPFDSIGENS
jgi:hypothetical protein